MTNINKCFIGDTHDGMRQMIADGIKVHTIVTSPPYFGLRDYGTAQWDGGDAGCDHMRTFVPVDSEDPGIRCSTLEGGKKTTTAQSGAASFRSQCGKCGARRIDAQIGLESTPAEYIETMVDVFRLVRELLADDGTVWVNMGDSYTSGGRDSFGPGTNKGQPKNAPRAPQPSGLKPKDLIGMPWRLAFALQQPYYTGSVKHECDRVWLAAMLDAEGSICGTEYLTGDRTKTNIYISITNTSVPIIDKCERLFPQAVKHVYEKSGPSSRVCYRWDVERMETKALFIREIYPYLVAKKKQAIIGYTFLEMQRGLLSKKRGYLQEQHEQRSWLMAALAKLNTGEGVDLPDWVVEPPSLFEPGFYLRQDVIWAKSNPMPESVTDRCTKAHEYLFLLTKKPNYFYDAEAVREPAQDWGTRNRSVSKYAKPVDGSAPDSWLTNGDRKESGRNKRSVWTIPSQAYPDAHFATFPEALVEPCILAGTSQRGHCPECGKRWVRVTEPTPEYAEKLKRSAAVWYQKQNDPFAGTGKKSGNMEKSGCAEYRTTGWQPSCACSAEPIPDLVFDPFMGSGTVARVAQRLGRSWLGCELSGDYVKLQNDRTRQHGMVLA